MRELPFLCFTFPSIVDRLRPVDPRSTASPDNASSVTMMTIVNATGSNRGNGSRSNGVGLSPETAFLRCFSGCTRPQRRVVLIRRPVSARPHGGCPPSSTPNTLSFNPPPLIASDPPGSPLVALPPDGLVDFLRPIDRNCAPTTPMGRSIRGVRAFLTAGPHRSWRRL